MLKKLIHSTRWRFILCVIITNMLSIVVTMFVWIPLSRNLFPAGHVLAPYIPMVIATLAAMPISSAISLHSAKPIQDMVEATKSISKGDFSVRVSEEGEGDIGVLLHSFNQMTAELGSTELMRNDFINTFSHEFKTPIVSIRGFARRLRSGNLTQRQQEEYLEFIAEESERLSNLASSVLLIAKYENQKLITGQTEYDLDEQIRTCILRLESQWSAKHILFDLDMPDLPYRNNMEMMDHVWMNLIGNAVKFSHEGGTIHISARNEKSHITVWIRDEGIGIDPEHIGHIFDKFFQEDTAHSSAGNGLGLSLVHRILELSGGEIQVESQVGQGTTFCIRLPRDQ
ncbi:MAG: sensor histidine kinase [Faecousia sp.]